MKSKQCRYRHRDNGRIQICDGIYSITCSLLNKKIKIILLHTAAATSVYVCVCVFRLGVLLICKHFIAFIIYESFFHVRVFYVNQVKEHTNCTTLNVTINLFVFVTLNEAVINMVGSNEVTHFGRNVFPKCSPFCCLCVCVRNWSWEKIPVKLPWNIITYLEA